MSIVWEKPVVNKFAYFIPLVWVTEPLEGVYVTNENRRAKFEEISTLEKKSLLLKNSIAAIFATLFVVWGMNYHNIALVFMYPMALIYIFIIFDRRREISNDYKPNLDVYEHVRENEIVRNKVSRFLLLLPPVYLVYRVNRQVICSKCQKYVRWKNFSQLMKVFFVIWNSLIVGFYSALIFKDIKKEDITLTIIICLIFLISTLFFLFFPSKKNEGLYCTGTNPNTPE